MSRLWKNSITVTRYGEEQRSATGRLLSPASGEPFEVPRCLVQTFKKGATGFQVPEGRKQEEYVRYSGPTELLPSSHIGVKRRPDTFVFEGVTYSVVYSMPLRGRQRTDCFYAVAELVDNPTRNTP